MTLNGVKAFVLFISANSIALQAYYITMVEGRPILSAEYSLPLLAKSDPPVARSLCDSWATCLLLWPWPEPDDLHIPTFPYPLKTYPRTTNELAKSGLSKVIVLQTSIHTPLKLYTTPPRGWSMIEIQLCAHYNTDSFDN